MSEQFAPLTKDGEKMLAWMKSNPNADGSLGHELKDGKEAVEWYRYFKAKHPEKLPYMVTRLREDKPYLVPSRWPWWYDITWTPTESKRPTVFPPKPDEDAEKRAALADSLLNRFRDIASGNDMYSQGMKPAQPKMPPVGSPEFNDVMREKGRALTASLRETEESGRLKDILAKIDRPVPRRHYRYK